MRPGPLLRPNSYQEAPWNGEELLIGMLWERIRSALPAGTLSVGTGLIVSGLTAYGFLMVSGRILGPERYAPLSILWTLVFLVAPGFFLPLEQEVGRRLAEGDEAGRSGRSILRAGSIAALTIVAVLVVLSAAGSSALMDRLLDGDELLFVALLASFLTYGCAFLIRGFLSGHGGFGRYAVIVGGEGVLRFGLCATLVAFGVTSAGPYGLAIAIAPLIAFAVLPFRSAGSKRGTATAEGLSSALVYLLLSSILAQGLINASPIAVKLLANGSQGADAGRFVAALVMARIPLFLFQAVQAALLPKLARLAAEGRREEFRHGLERILVLVGFIAVTTTAAAYAFGPRALQIFFGNEYVLAGRDLALMAAASCLCMAAIAFSQALIALGGHSRVAWGWIAGVSAFVIAASFGTDLFLRVELAFLAGATVATFVMGTMTQLCMSRDGGKRMAVRLLTPSYGETS